MIETVECKVYILDRSLEYREITFPAVNKNKATINIFKMDTMNDLKNKVFLVTGETPFYYHIRGLSETFPDWLKRAKAIRAANSNPNAPAKNRADFIPIQTKSTPDKYNYLGWNMKSPDATFPTLFNKGSAVIPDIPQLAIGAEHYQYVADIPIDRQYSLFNKLGYSTEDMRIGDISPIYEYVFIPLSDYIKPADPKANLLLDDANNFTYVYNGFITKYFTISSNEFIEYLRGNSPPNYESQIQYFTLENEILNTFQEESTKDRSKLHTQFNVSSATIATQAAPNQSQLILRNLFDKVNIAYKYKNAEVDTQIKSIKAAAAAAKGKSRTPRSPLSPDLSDEDSGSESGDEDAESATKIDATNVQDLMLDIQKSYINIYISTLTNQLTTALNKNTTHYIATKIRINNNDFKIPVDYKAKELLFVLSHQNRRIKTKPSFLTVAPDGSWELNAIWYNSYVELNKVFDVCNTMTAHIIRYFNSLKEFYAKNALLMISPTNSKITRLSINYIWNMQITDIEFKILYNIFKLFIESKMAKIYNSIYLDIIWKKGLITPCNIKIIHGNSTVRIEIKNIEYTGVEYLYEILATMLNIVNKKVRERRQKIHKEGITAPTKTSQSIIKKLREQDPKLYNALLDNGSYSRKCQNIRQPLILTDEEYRAMVKRDPKQQKNIYKYRNFTYGKPAYYMCQRDPKTNVRLSMSFITGIHEKNWCVPCCRKKPPHESLTDRLDKDKSCFDSGIYSSTKKTNYTYIFTFNKEIELGRLGEVPPIIQEIVGADLYCYGVPQVLPSLSSAGIVFCIANALHLELADYILSIIKYIKKNQSFANFANIFKTSAVISVSGGTNSYAAISPMNYYKDPNSNSSINHKSLLLGGTTNTESNFILDALYAIFIDQTEFYDISINWVEFFTELTLEIYNINVIIFKYHVDELYFIPNNSDKIVIVEYKINNNLLYYPIYKIDKNIFNKTKEIGERIFNNLPNLNSLVAKANTNTLDHVMSLEVAPDSNAASIKIHRLFINKNNRCYALLASVVQNSSAASTTQSGPLKVAYVPIIPSIILSKVETQYKPFIAADFNNETYILDIDTSITIMALLFGEFRKTIIYQGKCIAYVYNTFNCYINPIDPATLPEQLRALDRQEIDYNPETINEVIFESAPISDTIRDKLFEGYYELNFYKILKIEVLHLIDIKEISYEAAKKMSAEQLLAILPHEIHKDAQLTDNILISCNINNQLSYCNGKKILVPPNIKEYLDILLFEINDPYRNFLAYNREYVINVLQFEKNAGEIITIKRLHRI